MSEELTDREYEVILVALQKLANENLGIALRAREGTDSRNEFLELYEEANQLSNKIFGKTLMIK